MCVRGMFAWCIGVLCVVVSHVYVRVLASVLILVANVSLASFVLTGGGHPLSFALTAVWRAHEWASNSASLSHRDSGAC